MAVSAGDAYLDIGPRLTANFGRQLTSQVQAPISKAGEEASKHFGRSFAHGVGTAAKGIGVGIAAGLGVAVVAARVLAPVLKQSVQGYRDHLKVVADTSQTIRSMGNVSKVSAKQVSALSDAIERKTTVDGDLIQSGANILLTFGSIRNEVGKGNDIFNQATQTVTDLSVKFKQDFKSSAVQVGKALEDPIKGIGALTRVGVTFDAQQQKQIKTLIESGHKLEAQKVILAALNQQVGGAAAAQATASGRMQVAWHQLQDTIGSVLLPVVDRFENSLAKKVIPDLNVLATKYGPAIQATLLRWVSGFTKLLPSTKELGYGIDALGAAFSGEGITTQAGTFVGTMERLGVKGRQVVDWAKALGPQLTGIGQSFSKLFQGASQAGPALQSAGGGGHAFANSLVIIGPVLDVVARNLHNILPWLPAILAGFLAFRAIRGIAQPFVQLGEVISNLTAPFRIVALYGQRRALQAHTTALVENTAALRGNAVSEELATAANNGGVVASIRARAAMIGQAIAAKAVAVASKAWAAVQWLVNAALTANPIGIVIIAVAALAAGIIYAYKHSETFRRVVDTVFKAIKSAVGSAVNFIIGLLRGWLDVQFNVVAGIVHVMGKLPGPMGAPFRKAEEAVRGAKKTIDDQLNKVQARVNRLTGKTIDIKARTDVEITKSVRQYLAASNVSGFHARGEIIRKPTLAVVGEGRAPESVIPWDPQYRTRALDLWTTTGRQLGVPGFQMGALVGRFRNPTVAETKRIGVSEGKVAAAAMKQLIASFGGFGAAAAPGNVSGVVALGKALAAQMGWVGAQWNALYQLWQHESGWRWNATNPSSGAYGIPQALPASKMGSVASDWRTNPRTQILWGEGYIKGSYNNPGNAWAAWLGRSPHWYDQGGTLEPGLNLMWNGTGRREELVPAAATGPTTVNIYPAPGMSERRVGQMVVEALEARDRRARKGGRP